MKTALLVKTALMAAFMASSALFTIPIGPVPITLQTFIVLLAGAILGPTYGAASMVLYMLMGVIGLPVFSKGQAGLGVLLGPTGGYIIGFVVAAYFVGYVVSKVEKRFIKLLPAMLGGIIIIYLFGVVQLMQVTKMTIIQAVFAGVVPFIVFDIVKAVVASEIAHRLVKSEQ